MWSQYESTNLSETWTFQKSKRRRNYTRNKTLKSLTQSGRHPHQQEAGFKILIISNFRSANHTLIIRRECVRVSVQIICINKQPISLLSQTTKATQKRSARSSPHPLTELSVPSHDSRLLFLNSVVCRSDPVLIKGNSSILRVVLEIRGGLEAMWIGFDWNLEFACFYWIDLV